MTFSILVQKHEDREMKVNIGCGISPTTGWRNFDNSLSVKYKKFYPVIWLLSRMGIVSKGSLFFSKFAREHHIEYCNAVNRIPLKDQSVDVVYSSHMVEHLDREQVRSFLMEAKRVLKEGGCIRTAFPDLQLLIMQYNEEKDADAFMEKTGLDRVIPKRFSRKIMMLIKGDRDHKYLYDGRSFAKILEEIGFNRVSILKSGNTMIKDPGSLDLREREYDGDFLHTAYVEAFK